MHRVCGQGLVSGWYVMQTKPIPNVYELLLIPVGEAAELDPDSAWSIWDMAEKLNDAAQQKEIESCK